MKARIFRSEFTYTFPISPDWKFLRLYFYPTRYEYGFDAAKSNFSVIVNGFTLLRNFSANLTGNASKPEYLMKEFIVSVDQTLDLKFRPSPNSSAFVNGIEIVSMPDGLYSKGGFDDVITNAGGSVNSQIDNSTAFETVYRLNIGGQKIGEVGDSRMFRRWISDDEFLLGANSYLLVADRAIFPTLPDVKINYTEKTLAYVAPEDVYATCRSMGNVDNPELNLNFDMTWLFTIDAGFNYLVRLHFCETLPQVNEPDQQVFSIFIENQMAKKEMDVIRLSGGPRVPMYLDFSLNVGSKIGLKHDIRLDLHPLPNATPKYYNAILNGVEILKLNNSDGNLAGPNPNGPSPNGPNPNGSNPPIFMDIASNTVKGESNVLAIILIVVGSAIGLATFVSVIMLSMRKMKTKKNKKENSVEMFKVLLKQYTYADLKKITKSYSHTIGKGRFGIVYGGSLCNGRKVAVKVLKDSKGNGEDFINEVASMSQTSHVNIVSLLGFCYEGSKRAIVYEFLENGSLDQFMSRKESLTLDVTTLYGIALGIAQGLEYLHYGCKTRIVHFDIKPKNILLDENLCPKVSDFGLAKLCEKRESIFSLIDARGTIGYIAPEVFSRMYGRVSHKSDVYSYGMLVLEMIGSRNKNLVKTIDSAASSTYFPDWIYKDLEDGEQTWIFGDEITKEEKEIARKMILVGLWCIQPCPTDRPPMNKVVEMMEGSLDALDIPPKPSMHISTEVIPESSSLSGDEEAG
ncbi:Serine-threonine/tyrosine-protein kinase catalytic domain [Arabidopsis thaliana x Arabidopsis arenosa]|uniref:Serine-threonine/tyrosine-protein kinase catalytic domain n=1 Tax=Arabidopsis thaliana x Arabidopsis arenosa TaxID=1240361 RepID=A0A8T1YD33_9BRAS|nr:Serine-threonine/tyrosine-protein kinase catalytic domain [Arabidopsis thaliana x Arabidopsis arenosa]